MRRGNKEREEVSKQSACVLGAGTLAGEREGGRQDQEKEKGNWATPPSSSQPSESQNGLLEGTGAAAEGSHSVFQSWMETILGPAVERRFVP